jgi:hypothetical protein
MIYVLPKPLPNFEGGYSAFISSTLLSNVLRVTVAKA